MLTEEIENSIFTHLARVFPLSDSKFVIREIATRPHRRCGPISPASSRMMQTLFTITSAATCEKRTSKTTSSSVCEITNTLRPTPNWFEAAVLFILCFVYSNNPRLFADNRVNHFCEILVRKKYSKIHSSSLSAKRIISLAELISCARWYANRAILSSLYV